MKEKMWGYKNCTVEEFVTHLETVYGIIQAQDLQARQPHQVNSPMGSTN